MSYKHKQNLKIQGKIVKNTISLNEDALLHQCALNLTDLLKVQLRVPDDWSIEFLNTISTGLLVKKLLSDGIPRSYISYLVSPNPNGEPSEIQPDGGCIAAIKRNEQNEIVLWYPLVISESKHQGTEDEPKQAKGNAIERVFKNYNFVTKLCHRDKVTPFVCFCQGCDIENEFVRNKIRQGACEVNIENIKTNDYDLRQASFWMRTESWTENEILEKLKSCAIQAWDYYKSRME